jgi:hypothetical protein
MKQIWTFELFWWKFHEINLQYKRDKTNTKRYWDKINCIGKKKKLIKGIVKTKLTCLDYLKLHM